MKGKGKRQSKTNAGSNQQEEQGERGKKLKKVTRGQKVNEDLLHELIASLDIPQEAKDELLNLTPSNYTGIAKSLAEKI